MVVINWIVEKKKERKENQEEINLFFFFKAYFSGIIRSLSPFLWSLNCSLAAKNPSRSFWFKCEAVGPGAQRQSPGSYTILTPDQTVDRVHFHPLAALHPGAPRPCEGRVTQPSPPRGSPAPVHDWGLPGLPDRIPSRTACSSTRKTHSNQTWLLFEFTLDDLDSSCKIQTAVCAGNAAFNKAQNSIKIQQSLTQTCTYRHL